MQVTEIKKCSDMDWRNSFRIIYAIIEMKITLSDVI